MNRHLHDQILRLAGTASRTELRRLGVTRGAIDTALRLGELHRLAPSIYAMTSVDRTTVTFRRRLALAAGGCDAVLSHQSAAVLWGLSHDRVGDPVHVSLPLSAPRRKVPGVLLHRSAQRDFTVRHGWRVSTVRRALQELSISDSDDALRFPALAAVQQGLITVSELSDLSGVPRQGFRRWELVGEEARMGAHSGGEGRYWRLLHSTMLPLPELNVPIPGYRYRADALWQQWRLAVEIDGWEAHGDRQAFESDRVRQNDFHLAGYVVLRFTVGGVMTFPGRVVDQTERGLLARARDLGVPLAYRQMPIRQPHRG